jgi:hypothetical protein
MVTFASPDMAFGYILMDMSISRGEAEVTEAHSLLLLSMTQSKLRSLVLPQDGRNNSTIVCPPS